MGLLDAVGRALGRRAALKDMKATPFREACSLAISHKLDDTKLREHWSPEAVERIAGWLWQECLGIEAHENPRALPLPVGRSDSGKGQVRGPHHGARPQ